MKEQFLQNGVEAIFQQNHLRFVLKNCLLSILYTLAGMMVYYKTPDEELHLLNSSTMLN